MTVNQYKAQNPNKVFYLKGTQGHIYNAIATNGLIPEIYESEILGTGRMKVSKILVLKINWDFINCKRS